MSVLRQFSALLGAAALVLAAPVASQAGAPAAVTKVRTVNLGDDSGPSRVVIDPERHIAYTEGAYVVIETNLTTGRTIGVPLTGARQGDYLEDIAWNSSRRALIVLTATQVILLRGTTVISRVALPTSGDWEATFDAQNGLLYLLSNEGLGEQLVIMRGTKVVASYTDDDDPFNEDDGPPVVDSSSGLVYVPLKGVGLIDVVSGATIVKQIATDEYPYLLAIDDVNGLIYDESVAGVMDVIKNGAVVDRYTTGGDGFSGRGLYIDRSSEDVYVTSADGTVILHDGTELGHLSGGVSAAVLDPTRNLLYAETDGKVEIIKGTKTVKRVAAATTDNDIPAQQGGMYDAADDLTVVNLNRSVVLFRGLKRLATLKTGWMPVGEALDRSRHDIAVTNNQAGTLTELHARHGA